MNIIGVDWQFFENYGNTPRITIRVSKEPQDLVFENRADMYLAFFGEQGKQVAKYGHYRNEERDSKPLFTRPGKYKLKVKEGNEVVEKTFNSWSSSRAGVMNEYHDIEADSDMFITDNPVVCDNVVVGFATLGLIKDIALRYRSHDLFIIKAVDKNPKNNEDSQPRYIPSLTPDYFLFKEKEDHKGREFAKKHWAVETL